MFDSVRNRGPFLHPGKVQQNYAAMVEHLDAWLGAFRQEIAMRGETARTIVCFTSDHGDMLGDGGQYGKQTPKHSAVAVPLACAGPGIKPGLVVTDPVATLDIAATILDFADVKAPAAMTARSLRSVLAGSRPARSVRQNVLVGLGSWNLAITTRDVSIITRSFKISPKERQLLNHSSASGVIGVRIFNGNVHAFVDPKTNEGVQYGFSEDVKLAAKKAVQLDELKIEEAVKIGKETRQN